MFKKNKDQEIINNIESKINGERNNDFPSFFNSNLAQKINGNNAIYDLIDEIINNWIIYFKFENWPFKEQEKSEFFNYLFKYGILWITKINDILFFFPIKKNQLLLSKFSLKNIKNYPIVIEDFFDKRINKLIINDIFLLKMPFIFINQNQTSYLSLINYAFQDISDLEEIAITNRIMKIKTGTKYNNKSNSYQSKLIDYIKRRDPSPFFYLDSDKDTFLNQLFGKKSDMVDSSADYSNSIINERNYFEHKIKSRCGVFNSIKFNKSSAQETDSQVFDSDIETINNLRVIFESLKKSLKRINSIFSLNIKISFSDFIEKKIRKIEELINNNGDNNVPK